MASVVWGPHCFQMFSFLQESNTFILYKVWCRPRRRGCILGRARRPEWRDGGDSYISQTAYYKRASLFSVHCCETIEQMALCRIGKKQRDHGILQPKHVTFPPCYHWVRCVCLKRTEEKWPGLPTKWGQCSYFKYSVIFTGEQLQVQI